MWVEQSRKEAAWHMCVCMCPWDTEGKGRVQLKLYLELFLGPLKIYTAMQSTGSVYRMLVLSFQTATIGLHKGFIWGRTRVVQMLSTYRFDFCLYANAGHCASFFLTRFPQNINIVSLIVNIKSSKVPFQFLHVCLKHKCSAFRGDLLLWIAVKVGNCFSLLQNLWFLFGTNQ